MAAASVDLPGKREGEEKAPAGMVKQLASLDLKMDCLSKQMEECLLGIQGLAGTRALAISSHLSSASSAANSERTTNSEMCVQDGGRLECARPITSEQLPRPSTRLSPPSTRLTQGSRREVSVREDTRRQLGSTAGRLSYIGPPSSAKWRVTRMVSVYTAFPENAVGHRRSLSSGQHRVWKFMSDPESSMVAGLYSRFNTTFILLAVLISVVADSTMQILNPDIYMGIECFIEALFLLEISALFSVCPYRKYFFLKTYNIIDILSVLPLALRVYKIAAGGYDEVYTIVCAGFVPAVRLLKALRHFQTSRLLANAFILAQEAVPILVFYYAVVWLLFTAIIYTVEERSNMKSMSDAMWLTVVTMTTIGYGDVIPASGAGKMAAAVLVLVSTLYMAIPLGIIGSCFSAVWDDRDKILLFERLRTCFMEVGCSDCDVPQLFSRYDKTNAGSLDALEFLHMCSDLKLGLSEERLMMLFSFWANEEDGRIEATTFQQILFPRDCLKVLERQAQEQLSTVRTPKSIGTGAAI